jgi:hypothetical protein
MLKASGMDVFSDQLFWIVWAVLTALVSGLLIFSTGWKGKIDPITGHLVMRYSPPAKVLGALAGLIAVVVIPLLVVGVFVFGQLEWWGYCCGGYLLVGFIPAGIHYFVKTNCRQIVVSPSGIDDHWPRNEIERLRWNEVKSAHVWKRGGLFFSKGVNAGGLVIPAEMTGIKNLIDAMKQYLAPEIYQPALQELDDYRSGKLHIR